MRFLVWLVTGIVERDFWLSLIGIKRDSCAPRERRCSLCDSTNCLGESFGDDLKRWWLQLWWPLIQHYELREIRREIARGQVANSTKKIL